MPDGMPAVRFNCQPKEEAVLAGIAVIDILIIGLFVLAALFSHGYMHATWYNVQGEAPFANTASFGLFSVISCSKPDTDVVSTSWRCYLYGMGEVKSTQLAWATVMTLLSFLFCLFFAVLSVLGAACRIGVEVEHVKQIHWCAINVVLASLMTLGAVMACIFYPAISPSDLSASALAGSDVTQWTQFYGWTIFINVMLALGFAVALLLFIADAGRTFFLSKERTYTEIGSETSDNSPFGTSSAVHDEL